MCWYEYWEYLYIPGGYWAETCDFVTTIITLF
jgi:hypothetical protein